MDLDRLETGRSEGRTGTGAGQPPAGRERNPATALTRRTTVAVAATAAAALSGTRSEPDPATATARPSAAVTSSATWTGSSQRRQRRAPGVPRRRADAAIPRVTRARNRTARPPTVTRSAVTRDPLCDRTATAPRPRRDRGRELRCHPSLSDW